MEASCWAPPQGVICYFAAPAWITKVSAFCLLARMLNTLCTTFARHTFQHERRHLATAHVTHASRTCAAINRQDELPRRMSELRANDASQTLREDLAALTR